MKPLYRILLFVFLPLRLFSQLDNSSLLFNTQIDTSQEQRAFVKIQNLDYMKNNEYSGGIADGYTLFGVQLNPQIGYQFTKNLSIEGGIFINKDFGTKNFTIVEPTYSLRYYKNDFKFVFGNIDGSLNHQLIEPIYNFERVMTNRLESGAQATLTKKYFDFDVWVDWLSMAYRGGSTQEKLLGGVSANVLKLKGDKFEFRIPFQGTALHKGGQLDTLNLGSSTDMNLSTGVVLTYNTGYKYIKSIYMDTRVARRTNNYYDSINVISRGDGILANIGFKGHFKTDVMLSYWYCDNYYNEFGGHLYSSKSSHVSYPYYSERIRQLYFLRITKKIDLAKGISLTLRIEPYYETRWQWFEYSYGFYISLDERFWLKKKSN